MNELLQHMPIAIGANGLSSSASGPHYALGNQDGGLRSAGDNGNRAVGGMATD